jgi:opacity protein-like surface antigen
LYSVRCFKTVFFSAAILVMLLPVIGLAESRPAAGWRHTLTAAYAWQGASDLADQGSFSVDRGVVEYRTATRLGKRWFAGISAGYGEDRYHFDSTPANFTPWQDIRSLQFGLALRYLADNNWTLFGLPVLRYSAEENVSLNQGREYGLIAGASYRFSDRLTIGPGLGAFQSIGNEDDVFPVLFINWRMTDTLSVETGRGLAATRGPGLTLQWRPMQKWQFGVAARYEKYRFRLDDGADGIGQDKSVPVIATASWQSAGGLKLSALAGVETAGVLSLENRDGSFVTEQTYSTAPIAGLVASFSF